MKQMAQYSKTEMGKYGPRMKARIYNHSYVDKAEDIQKPKLINPDTKTWFIWDSIIKDYVDTKISIIKE